MTTDINKDGLFQKHPWLKWFFILPILAAALYFSRGLFPDDFSKSPIFTQYKELKDTVLLVAPDTLFEYRDTLLMAEDTLRTTDSISIEIPIDSTFQGEETPIDSTLVIDSIVIDESYKFGQEGLNEDKNIVVNGLSQAPHQTAPLKTDLFNELITPDTLQAADQTFLTNKVVSSKTLLKILATVGKDVLINGNTADAKEIFESIAEEEAIVGILIADRKGKIVYSSNSKFLNGNVKIIFPALDMTSPVIGLNTSDEQVITSLAVYHTYGQIGNIILVTEGE